MRIVCNKGIPQCRFANAAGPGSQAALRFEIGAGEDPV
jgi:hypothetical protein